MLGRDYDGEICSVARALELVGERWTLLILRESFRGARRFDEFVERLGIARNVLAARLDRLVERGLLERRRYQERPERFEYRLTDKGRDMWPVMMSLMNWGDRHAAPDGPPVVLEHRGCGGALDDRRRCERCGADLGPRDVVERRGPGAPAAATSSAASAGRSGP